MLISVKRTTPFPPGADENLAQLRCRGRSKTSSKWTAGLDRESVREALAHFQALNEQQEREEFAQKGGSRTSLFLMCGCRH